ncbi:18910_t:CDS:1, partial [Gigaspora rosea]
MENFQNSLYFSLYLDSFLQVDKDFVCSGFEDKKHILGTFGSLGRARQNS